MELLLRKLKQSHYRKKPFLLLLSFQGDVMKDPEAEKVNIL